MVVPRMISGFLMMNSSYLRLEVIVVIEEYFSSNNSVICQWKDCWSTCVNPQIKDGFAEGKDLVVTVMSAMGEEQICALKDIGPK